MASKAALLSKIALCAVRLAVRLGISALSGRYNQPAYRADPIAERHSVFIIGAIHMTRQAELLVVLAHAVRFAFSFAAESAGRKHRCQNSMMAMTTNSSIRGNPLAFQA